MDTFLAAWQHFYMATRFRVKLPNLRWIVRKIYGLVVISIAVIAAYNGAKEFEGGGNVALVYFLLLFSFASVVGILIHEIGHALAAWLVGWRVHVIAVGPLAFNPKRRVFMRSPKHGHGDVGGFVVATPPIDGDWRKGTVAHILGGPVANFLTAAVAFIWLDTGNLESAETGVLGSLAIISMLMGFVNLLPYREGNFRSDGAVLVDFIRRKERPSDQRLAWLFGYIFDEVSPSLWDEKLLEEIERDARESEADHSLDYFVFSYWLGRSDLPKAKEALGRLLAGKMGAVPELKVEQAFIVARLDRDAALAKQILSSVASVQLQKNYNYWRAVAVVYDVEGDSSGVLRAIEAARRCNEYPFDGPDTSDRDLLQELENRAIAKMSAEKSGELK